MLAGYILSKEDTISADNKDSAIKKIGKVIEISCAPCVERPRSGAACVQVYIVEFSVDLTRFDLAVP